MIIVFFFSKFRIWTLSLIFCILNFLFCQIFFFFLLRIFLFYWFFHEWGLLFLLVLSLSNKVFSYRKLLLFDWFCCYIWFFVFELVVELAWIIAIVRISLDFFTIFYLFLRIWCSFKRAEGTNISQQISFLASFWTFFDIRVYFRFNILFIIYCIYLFRWCSVFLRLGWLECFWATFCCWVYYNSVFICFIFIC